MNILLLEDNIDDVELIKFRLKKDGLVFNMVHVMSLEDFVFELKNATPDIILSDFSLKGFTALDVLDFVSIAHAHIPFIIVTGSLEEETAAHTIKSGAWDYVVKERIFRLHTAIKSAMVRVSERQHIYETEKQIKILSLAIQQASTSVVITGCDGIIQYANPKFTELTGYFKSEYLNRSIDFLKSDFHSKDFHSETLNTVLSGNEWRGEMQYKKKNGELIWVSASIKGIKVDGAEVTNIIFIHEDITKKKE